MRFDFPTLIVVLVFATGIIWAFDAAVLARRRRAVARQAEGASEDAVAVPPSRIVEYSKSFFPVFLIVLVLRSFIVEPFRIPSNSMMPTLLTGDFILVNKFDYGIRLPVVDTKIVDIGLPERGDVVVFRFPDDPATPFIKRVVGVPGDRVGYYDKVLYVNDEPMEQSPLGRYVGSGSGTVMSGASLRWNGSPASTTVSWYSRGPAPFRARRWCPRATTSCWATIGTTAGTAGTGARCRRNCSSARRSESG